MSLINSLPSGETGESILATILSYLPSDEQDVLVQSVWKDFAEKSAVLFERIRGQTLFRFGMNPSVAIGERRFKNLDPSGKVLNNYFRKNLKGKSVAEQLRYLRQLTVEQRACVHSLEVESLNNMESLLECFKLCLSLRSLKIKDSTEINHLSNLPLERLEELSLRGIHIQDKHLKNLGRCTNLKSLYISSSELTGEFLAEAPLERLEELSLSGDLNGDQIQDEHLKRLGRCTNLKSLCIDSVRLTGEFLAEAPLERLEKLSLSGNHIQDEYLKNLGRCTNLKSLCIDSLGLTGEFLAEALLERLEKLFLKGTQIQDEHLKRLGRCTNLKSLCIDSSELTGEFLAEAPFERLEKLSLRGMHIQDEHLKRLGRCTNLESLHISSFGGIGGWTGEFLAEAPLEHLEELFLDGDQLQGKYLKNLRRCNSLNQLDIDSSNLTLTKKTLEDILTVDVKALVLRVHKIPWDIIDKLFLKCLDLKFASILSEPLYVLRTERNNKPYIRTTFYETLYSIDTLSLEKILASTSGLEWRERANCERLLQERYRETSTFDLTMLRVISVVKDVFSCLKDVFDYLIEKIGSIFFKQVQNI